MLNSFLGIIAGSSTIYLTGVIFDVVYFKLLKRPSIQGETQSMGGGDVKFLAMIGAFLGWKNALFTFFVAPIFGLIFGLANLILKKDHTIPYGPFLALGAFVSMFWMEKVLAFVFLR
jgi:prepilin signal peptidase PulO-like enzyme (type II secretory pathway)